MKSFPEQVARFLPNQFIALGTDGYGRSDSREALRSFFEVDRHYIVVAALTALVDMKKLDVSVLLKAIKDFKLDGDKPNPMSV
jgi:pyruvate dehydrogenase E1 component